MPLKGQSIKSTCVLRRLPCLLVAVGALCVLPFILGAAADPAVTPEDVARRYGLDAFDTIQELRYTFHVRRDDTEVTRGWTWHPQTGHVLYQGVGENGRPLNLVFNTADVAADSPAHLRQVHQWFINDQYWLLFPLHVAWDTAATVAVDDGIALPLGAGAATRLTVTYPPTGGYTPGDVYELYVGEDALIRAWAYRRGGVAEATLVTTWERHERVGPLTLSLLHTNAEGDFRLWFSDVDIVTTPP